MAYLDQILCDTSMVWKRGCIIRILNGCEVRIENSITKVSLVMLNSCPEWWNFQFALNNYYRFFFLHTLPLTTAFKLKCVLFCLFHAKISTFFVKTCLVPLLHLMLTLEHLAENDLKNWRRDVQTASCRHALHPSCKTFPSPGRVHRNSGQVPKKSNWAASWQNHQNDCASSKDSDQPGHLPVWSESSLCA